MEDGWQVVSSKSHRKSKRASLKTLQPDTAIKEEEKVQEKEEKVEQEEQEEPPIGGLLTSLLYILKQHDSPTILKALKKDLGDYYKPLLAEVHQRLQDADIEIWLDFDLPAEQPHNLIERFVKFWQHCGCSQITSSAMGNLITAMNDSLWSKFESGGITDATVIHAAFKSTQKRRVALFQTYSKHIRWNPTTTTDTTTTSTPSALPSVKQVTKETTTDFVGSYAFRKAFVIDQLSKQPNPWSLEDIKGKVIMLPVYMKSQTPDLPWLRYNGQHYVPSYLTESALSKDVGLLQHPSYLELKAHGICQPKQTDPQILTLQRAHFAIYILLIFDPFVKKYAFYIGKAKNGVLRRWEQDGRHHIFGIKEALAGRGEHVQLVENLLAFSFVTNQPRFLFVYDVYEMESEMIQQEQLLIALHKKLNHHSVCLNA